MRSTGYLLFAGHAGKISVDMKLISILSVFLVTTALSIAACSGSSGTGGGSIPGDTPTEAYKRLFNAVKAKDTNAIREQMTKKTIEFGESTAKQFNKTPEQHFANAFTATTMSDTLPAMRDERVKENMGALEVWNSKNSIWEDLPFIHEDGRWKFAIGDHWAGTYKSPGKGRDVIDKEAANMLANTAPVNAANSNANSIPMVNAPRPNIANK
jgi:hypothetical protein